MAWGNSCLKGSVWSFSNFRESGACTFSTQSNDFFFSSVLDADGPTVDRCRGWCSATGTAFFRFSPLMGEEIELDETNDKKLVDLMWSAMVMVHTRRDDVEKLKRFVVQDRLPSLSSMEMD